jgi:YVTN family beta-propeller protein
MDDCRANITRWAEIALLLTVLLAAPGSVGQTLVTTVTVGANPVAVAVNTTTGKVYVANQDSNTVTVIDGATNNPVNVPTGAGPAAVAVNPLTNSIYVANGDAGTLTVIDGATNHTSTITAGSGAGAIAINLSTNMVYVANGAANTVTAIDGATHHTTNISVGRRPTAIAIDSATNKIFAANYASGDVSIIDGVTNAVTTIVVGTTPRAIAVNERTNQIYVANYGNNTVSVIDGHSLTVTSVAVPNSPLALAIDPVRNKILVASSATDSGTMIDGSDLSVTSLDAGSAPYAVGVDALTGKAYFVNHLHYGTVTMVDEASGGSNSVSVGANPTALAINPSSNQIYVINSADGTVSVLAGGTVPGLQFVAATPCRIVDTRRQPEQFGGPYISGGTSRSFAVPQSACNIPATATVFSLNVTVVPRAPSLGYLTIWPADEAQPFVSTLNSPDGRVKANAAIVPAGAGGAVAVYVSDSSDVILDINGYFQPADWRTLQFFPVPLCRVFDTRWTTGVLGGPYVHRGSERDFPVLASDCQLPTNALAYSMNFTVVPVAGRPLGYLTVWPAGSAQPFVSTLNNPTATTLANAAIVPAGASGAIAVYADEDTQLIADVNGYFAPPASGGLALYPLSPCRVLDTRATGGAFSGQRSPPVPVTASSCGIPSLAQEYVFNATVVPIGSLGYLTLWAHGDGMPNVSTLNATDGMTASNMAIIGNHDGQTDAYAFGLTQLILDITSYFAP